MFNKTGTLDVSEGACGVRHDALKGLAKILPWFA